MLLFSTVYSIDGYSEWANRIILWQITSSYAVSKSGCFFSFFGIGYDYAFRQFSIVWLTQIPSSSFLWANKVSSKIGSCLHNPFKIKGEDKQCNARTFVFKQIMFLLHISIDTYTYRKRRRERRTQTKIHVYCNEKAKNFNFQLHHKTNYLTTLTISNYNTIEMNPFNIMPAKSMWMS